MRWSSVNQAASTRSERDQLADERQLQIRQRAKLELDLKDLYDICDEDLATKVLISPLYFIFVKYSLVF